MLGDALCSFIPIYGQGMSVAALEALALRPHLRPHLRRGVRPLRVLRDLAAVVDPAWDLVVGADLPFPGVPGRRSLRTRLIGRYVARVHAGAARDPALGGAFLRVAGLVDRPEALLRPGGVGRVLRAA